MQRQYRVLERLKMLTSAVARFPFTAAFLVAASVTLAISIQKDTNHEKLLLTYAVGAMLGTVFQVAYERFSRRASYRVVLYGCGAVLTLAYYLLVRQAPEHTEELFIRTLVALFALFFAFLWVPVMKSKVTFNESYMAAFKAFFHSLLYAAVLFGGCSLIIRAIDTLIVRVSYKSFAHVANLVFVLFAPLFFLSLIPVYPGEAQNSDREKADAQDETVLKAASCPKVLEVLISYIIIPLTAVYTVILCLYIALNIKGEFWANNLLEPLLISYAVVVILVYILASRMENKFTALFRLIFPKVLIPIVLFQITASVLTLRQTGFTHGRYFVILFGAFAACAGFVMSFFPIRNNGLIAALLILFSAVSVIPPVDAFTVSRISQESRLEAVLSRNGMLQNNTVTPNAAVSAADKEMIVASAEYLSRMGYTNKIEWMPRDFRFYEDFNDTFGFNPYDLPQQSGRSFNAAVDSSRPVDISGYHFFTRAELTSGQTEASFCEFEYMGASYVLVRDQSGDMADLVLKDADGREVIRFDADEISSRYAGYFGEKTALSPEEATFTAENERVKLGVVVQNVSMNTGGSVFGDTYYYVDMYVLIRFK